MRDAFRQKRDDFQVWFDRDRDRFNRMWRCMTVGFIIVALAGVSWVGFLIYVGSHFLSKFW